MDGTLTCVAHVWFVTIVKFVVADYLQCDSDGLGGNVFSQMFTADGGAAVVGGLNFTVSRVVAQKEEGGRHAPQGTDWAAQRVGFCV